MFSPALRRVVLVSHIVASVGWMGAVAAFIVLDAATVASEDEPLLRAAYIGMDLITKWAVVPLAFLASTSGVAISLGTKWGLVRHWWVVVTLLLTVASTIVLLVQLPIIAHRADAAADQDTTADTLRGQGNLLLHSIGGFAVLLVVAILNIVKPRGLTRHGWRKQRDEAGNPGGSTPETGS